MVDEKLNPTGRFTGLAQVYASARPSYPPAAIDAIVERCRLKVAGSLLVDVGCGTGISSRLIAERGIRVIGIEPNSDMRKQAEQDAGSVSGILTFQVGTAESTGLPDCSADAVLAAQAFHWFEPERALKEFARILKSRGWVVLMWNERDEQDRFTAGYGAAFRNLPRATIQGIERNVAPDPLFDSPLFEDSQSLNFENSQTLDENGILDRAFSASYAPRDEERAGPLRRRLQNLWSEFQVDGMVQLKYKTSVYLARKRN